jgi:excinuclease ABC subunit B
MTFFKLNTKNKPTGDQPQAIDKLVNGFFDFPCQTLLGVTGSGKTFTIANVIEKINKPTLIISHNKTLAAQLYYEFKSFFPNNKVCYFISYYDYYQPESYLPVSDTYIEKDVLVNEKINEFRNETAVSLVDRKDVIVVASVSCIYGFGNPTRYKQQMLNIKVGEKIDRNEFLSKLTDMQYTRNDTELNKGIFRVRGDIIDVEPGYGQEIFRIEFFDDEIEKLSKRTLLGEIKQKDLKELRLYPSNPFVINKTNLNGIIRDIKKELNERQKRLEPLMAHRLKQKTNYDLEMIKEIGFCKGIENYSRYFDGRQKGAPPYCLLDFFPKDFLLIIDESHVTLPQVRGMYFGDRSRKTNLIDYGFRLPSALDNRPLKFDEFEKYMNHCIFMSATPGDYELSKSGKIVQQLIRPTGLLDPKVEIRPIKNQINDLLKEIKKTAKKDNRILVTTLTKKMAEELAEFLFEKGIKVKYLHSEIDTIERSNIIRNLRLGRFDCLVGVNLLREGLDLPEVELIIILDADKEGFLRNERSLIQTMGRAARNVEGKVILYADNMTKSIKAAVYETEKRRKIQIAYNTKHKIKPKSIKNPVKDNLLSYTDISKFDDINKIEIKDTRQLIAVLENQMRRAAEALNFEKAIELREKINDLKSHN